MPTHKVGNKQLKKQMMIQNNGVFFLIKGYSQSKMASAQASYLQQEKKEKKHTHLQVLFNLFMFAVKSFQDKIDFFFTP